MERRAGNGGDGSGSTARPGAFAEARHLLLEGGAGALATLLDAEPGVVRRRWPGDQPPYDGYFHQATLLHHVAGNPLIRPLPDDMVARARLLLEAGAEVDAVTRAGPSQPDDVGWTALGLVATSAQARERGVQRPLLDLLLDAGADPDARNGGGLMGALYYGEGEAARHLADAGARLDLVAAAGLGRVEALAGFLAEGPDGWLDGAWLHHYARVPWPRSAPREEQAAHRLGMALVYAALHGRVEALRLLLQAGADPDHRPPFDHQGTALHWAVMGDRPEAVRALLAAGADPEARDREHQSTPAGWADHLGRARAAEALAAGS